MIRSRSLLLSLLALSFAACDSNDPTCEDAGNCTTPADVVFVGNQGNFSENNGTVTRYDIEAGVATQDAVRVPTDGGTAPLGGLAQALAFGPDGRLFTLLNFSTGGGRLDIADAETGRVAAQVDVPNPRGIAFAGTRAYVSNLFENTVTPVDLTTNTAGSPIPVGSYPEGVAAVGNRVYVANSGFGEDSTVTVIDAATSTVTTTIDVGCQGPRSLAVDAEQEVWVFCTGQSDFTTGTVLDDAQAVVLDGATGAVEARIALTGTLGAASLGQDAYVSNQAGLIHVIQGQTVIRFDCRANRLVETVDVGPEPISGIGYDEAGIRLYLGRLDPAAANPYAAAGFVSIHRFDGERVGTFAAGVVPASFAVRSTFLPD